MLGKHSAIGKKQNSVSAREAESVLQKNWLLTAACTFGVSFSKQFVVLFPSTHPGTEGPNSQEGGI